MIGKDRFGFIISFLFLDFFGYVVGIYNRNHDAVFGKFILPVQISVVITSDI
jgi:hypothetical protein